MIIGIGVDQVAVKRFISWHADCGTRLHKLLSAEEITYCLSAPCPQQQAERFAARFAAREAFFKAYTAAATTLGIPPAPSLLSLLKHVCVDRNQLGIPSLKIQWNALHPTIACNPPKVHLSLSHTADLAVAFVVLEASTL